MLPLLFCWEAASSALPLLLAGDTCLKGACLALDRTILQIIVAHILLLLQVRLGYCIDASGHSLEQHSMRDCL